MISTLKAAKSAFGSASKLVSTKIDASGINEALNDQKIALGTARDYIRWAQSTEKIKYSVPSDQRSDRKPVVLESTRFSYLWTATDALFSRNGIHSLFSPIPSTSSELDRFTNVFNFASIPAATQTDKLNNLMRILRSEIHTNEPIPEAVDPTMEIWQMIYYKYTVNAQKSKGFGKYMKNCITNNQPFNPTLPQLIYGSRNWHFHGVLLSTSFRGPVRRQLLYYTTLNEVLAELLRDFAVKIQTKI